MEKFRHKKINVKNIGSITLEDWMGDTHAVCRAARVSNSLENVDSSKDRNLIRYLMRNRHTSPFEMCEIKFMIEAPIFVARQWLRHRTANVNEVSGRYIELEEFYVPEKFYHQSTDNKQGSGNVLENLELADVKSIFKKTNDINKATYKHNLLEDYNLAKEQARMILPLNTMTKFFWKIDLHNLLHFIKLRIHSHAQYEIREFAKTILNFVELWVPDIYEAFKDYRLDAVTISGPELEQLKKMLEGNKSNIISNSRISKREANNLNKILGLREV